MNEKIIYIKSDEEIMSVIDKLVKTRAPEVFLVIPKGALLTQSFINLKLLKREADNLNKKIAIISNDPTAKRLAKKADFKVGDLLEEFDSESSDDEEEEEYENDEEGISEEKEETENEGVVMKKRITADKFEKFLKNEKRVSPARVMDIVKLSPPPEEKSAGKRIKEISEKAASFFLKKEKEENKKEPEEFESEGLPIKKYRRLPPKAAEIKTAALPPQDGYDMEPLYDDTEGFTQMFPRKTDKGTGLAGTLISSFSMKIFSIFIVSAALIAGFVLYLILPKAEIKITANQEKVPISLKISADKNYSQANPDLNTIPVQVIRLEEKQSGDFLTTGERQLNEKAKGTITVFNAYSSSPQALIETTRFLSGGGKIFRLTKTVTIPGAKIEEGRIVASSIDVQVEADQPGSDYNIGPSDFTIPGFKGSPKYDGFYGKSKNSMEGGSTDKIKVATQDDFNKAKDSLWQSLSEKIKGELVSQIPQDSKMLDDSLQIQIGEVNSSPEVGGKAEKFTLNISGVARALIFNEQDVMELVKNSLSKELAGGKKEFTNETSFDYKDVKADVDKGQASFTITGEQGLVWKVDVEEIKNTIAGKTEAEVRQIFSKREEIKEASFSLWPFWAKKIPKQTNKIVITVD